MSNACDRRRSRRYGVRLALRWRMTNGKKEVLEHGTGRTVDVSSDGIRFETNRPLPVGGSLELSIDWPAMLHDVTPLQLSVSGTIVRARGEHVAVQIAQYGFRTRGVERRRLAESEARGKRATP